MTEQKTIDQLIADGYIAVQGTKRAKDSVFYENENGEMGGRSCGTCGTVKVADDFNKCKRSRGGLTHKCKECVAEYRAANAENIAEHRAANKERKAEYDAEYRAANAERLAEYYVEHRRNNPEMYRRRCANRRARKRGLPSGRTTKQADAMDERFNGRCFISDSTNVHEDHVIPITAPNKPWNGGTTSGNMLPLDNTMNMRKHDKNVFKFIDDERKADRISEQELVNFYQGIEYLAKQDNMTLGEKIMQIMMSSVVIHPSDEAANAELAKQYNKHDVTVPSQLDAIITD